MIDPAPRPANFILQKSQTQKNTVIPNPFLRVRNLSWAQINARRDSSLRSE
jgi:hypothetical protein